MKNNIVEENKKRNNILFPPYNQLTGEGSPIERFMFYVDKERYLLLPKTMLTIDIIKEIHSYGGLHKYKLPQNHPLTIKTFREQFINYLYDERLNHDFEFYAITCEHIQDKATGANIPFSLRPAQRKILRELEKKRVANEPIRAILVKARQWGGSTFVQLYMKWIQVRHKINWNSVIGTDVISQGENIKAMYELSCDLYPEHLGTLTMKPFGKGNAREIKERGCRIYLGSMQKPDSLRSGNYAMAHFSEVAIWKETKGKKPEDVISSVSSSILNAPYTIIVEESTAKGEGNYFHKKWLAAVSGKSKFIPIFVAWFEIELYRSEFKDMQEEIEFAENLSKRGKELWQMGATLEGIKWYLEYQSSQNFSDWQMHEEFPSTPEEAFITSGERVIPIEYMFNVKKTTREPVYIGNILADGRKGEEALTNIHFVEDSKNGKCKIWALPDLENELQNRYVVSVDIGGRSEKADKSVIRVIDRYWRTEQGADEFVLTWRGNLDADLVVWLATTIAKWYDNALLVVESNTIDSKHQHTEGDHTYTVFDEIAQFYENIYVRENAQKVREGFEPNYGFHTNSSTKGAIIDNLIAALRDFLFIERDQEMINELNQYEFKDDRTMGAKEGCHDDVLMASAIGLFVSKNLPIPQPKIVNKVIKPKRKMI